jgi:hypothetical protein
LFGRGWNFGSFTINSKAINSIQVFIYWSIAEIKLKWKVLWFSTVQNRIEKAPALFNFYISIIQAAKHNYSKTTQNMVFK